MKKKNWGYFSIKHWSGEWYVYLLALLVFVAGIVLLAWFLWEGRGGAGWKEFVDDAFLPQREECNYRRALDGVCVAEEESVNPKLVAVMIENHVESRPPAGLAEASVVYEAPVEGNITRFLAVYPADRMVEKVGPVRSARPYYLDWLREYGTPLYMHVGGSPEALNGIEALNAFHMDEMSRGWYFWRSDDRSAPHNTYTSSKLWRKAIEDYGAQYRLTDYVPWAFMTSSLISAIAVDKIVVSFAPPWYEAVWMYSSSTGKYFRYQMNRPHVDENGMPIAADTVITQQMKVQVVDEIGRRAIATVGSGDARIFIGGREIRGTWKKESVSARTRWLDTDGNDIALASGKIWIEVVGRDNTVTAL